MLQAPPGPGLKVTVVLEKNGYDTLTVTEENIS
jgi:hypothetical protein